MKKILIATLVFVGFGGAVSAQPTTKTNSTAKSAPKMTIQKKISTNQTTSSVTPSPKPTTGTQNSGMIGKKAKKAAKKSKKAAVKHHKAVTKPKKIKKAQ